MTTLLVVFVGLASMLWLSVFGYLAALVIVARTRRRGVSRIAAYPDIAVVIPTLNEERLIVSKLQDLRRTDYPGHLALVVVDGGSTDRTVALVEQEIARGAPVRLLQVAEARGKTDQIEHALRLLPAPLIVVTDADAILEPDCIRELIAVLVDDPRTVVVGATVRPASALAEERIHWWFLNYLWWLEGEVLSAAVISGVCYAVRREAGLSLAFDAQAEDVHLALRAGARGHRVRTCRSALATEMRVPQTVRELLRFRCRRGALYVAELQRAVPAPQASLGWRVARRMRLWHFHVAPALAPVALALAAMLLWTAHWAWPLLAFAAFAAPVVVALCASTTLPRDRRWWHVGFAASRLLGLTWLSMAVMLRRTETPFGTAK